MTQKQLNLIQPYPQKNLILNGEFLISQRGTSFDFATPSTPLFSRAYTVDRFYFESQPLLAGGSEGKSPQVKVTQESFIQGSKNIPAGNPEKFLRVKFIDAGIALPPNSYTITNTVLDATQYLFGQTVTLSFWAKTSVPNRKIGTRLVFTTFIPAESNEIFFKTVKTRSENKWYKFVETFKVPASYPNYSASNNPSSFCMVFQMMFQCGSDASSTWNTTATLAIAGETIDIANLKLELGAVATPMPKESYLQQLLQCQRYYWEAPHQYIVDGCTAPFGAPGSAIFMMKFPVIMKQVPILSVSSSFLVHIPTVETTNRPFTGIVNITPECCQFAVSSIAATNSLPCFLELRKTSGQYFRVSAEKIN
ncbi:hypothetical protein FD723_40050 (plasmid) [Nostoc sp. C052]|uniref:hypothetical protein n=1 Tax=Nostoc sp. C052 TaxID=2576902 RepID=UPI0015C39092|nr:hypothetical protein [Nostoc sp. C052]QLE46407.1 hypothetical protein FD723_40050 [Nostoc sp. C052]